MALATIIAAICFREYTTALSLAAPFGITALMAWPGPKQRLLYFSAAVGLVVLVAIVIYGLSVAMPMSKLFEIFLALVGLAVAGMVLLNLWATLEIRHVARDVKASESNVSGVREGDA